MEMMDADGGAALPNPKGMASNMFGKAKNMFTNSKLFNKARNLF